jgi:catechol 2,3-dioxygenase-like lactoylglutathione lyase family enzyme
MSDRPVVDQYNLVTSDVEAAVAFYRLLGLDIPDTDPEWSHRFRSATTDGVDFDIHSEQFARQWDPGWRGGAGVLGFKVPTREAVDERYATLTGAGYRSQAAPHDAFWGSRYAIVEDPDGNPVGIMSPPEPEHRSAPPSG